MFYRRKFILGLIEQLGGQIDKIKIQKILFLITRNQEQPQFDFVPYKFGCYSFTASADLNKLVEKGFLSLKNNNYTLVVGEKYFRLIKEKDQISITKIVTQFKDYSSNDLMKYTYTTFPYWSINGIKAKELLDKKEYSLIQSKSVSRNDTTLFTIGYEGISIETYLNKLLFNDIKLLIDVRNNPFSMKFGFSKSILKKYCESLGIAYLHYPEVGIQSKKRKKLKNTDDYKELFDQYINTTLKKTSTTQRKIFDLLKKYHRVALTCFEAEISKCHRKHLAESIISKHDHKYNLKHI